MRNKIIGAALTASVLGIQSCSKLPDTAGLPDITTNSCNIKNEQEPFKKRVTYYINPEIKIIESFTSQDPDKGEYISSAIGEIPGK